MSDERRSGEGPDEFAGLEGASPDDPRVRALGPAARARLRAYQAFMAGEPPQGARVEEAERRLAETIAREVGVALGGEETGRAPAGGHRGGGHDRSGGWLRTLLGPRPRAAWAIAGVLAIAGASWWYALEHRAPGAPVMRGNVTPAPLATSTQRLGGGSVRLEWAPQSAAESYTLVFLSPELTELARVADLRDTHFDLRPGSLPRGLAPEAAVLWRVVAMRGGDEIERSRMASVRVP